MSALSLALKSDQAQAQAQAHASGNTGDLRRNSALVSPPLSSSSPSTSSPIGIAHYTPGTSASAAAAAAAPSPPSSYRLQKLVPVTPQQSLPVVERRFSASAGVATRLSYSPASLPTSSPAGAGSTGPLNTNSPLALAAAAAVTPEKLAALLTAQGPLPIRHITAHLALTVRGFGELSLSKQRRLIIAALDAEHHGSSPGSSGIRFEKVGWGRWAAVTRPKDQSAQGHQQGQQQKVITATALASAVTRRRTHSGSVRPPLSPLLKPLVGSSGAVRLARSQATSVWADDDDSASAAAQSVSPMRGSPATAATAAHALRQSQRRRRRSSVHRSRMAFKEYEDDEDDDEDDEDALDDEEEEEEDRPAAYDADDGVVGDLELDLDDADDDGDETDEAAERLRMQSKYKRPSTSSGSTTSTITSLHGSGAGFASAGTGTGAGGIPSLSVSAPAHGLYYGLVTSQPNYSYTQTQTQLQSSPFQLQQGRPWASTSVGSAESSLRTTAFASMTVPKTEQPGTGIKTETGFQNGNGNGIGSLPFSKDSTNGSSWRRNSGLDLKEEDAVVALVQLKRY